MGAIVTDTTSGEFIEAVRGLADRFAGRLSNTDAGWVRSAAEAGEWAEALEQLAAGFVHAETSITTAERDELAGLFQTASADLEVLDEVRIG